MYGSSAIGLYPYGQLPSTTSLPPPPEPLVNRLRYYNGSSWVVKPLKYYNGSAWVEKPIKFYNGSSWS